MSDLIIAPSILSSDFANLESEIKRLEDNGADWVHVDVMDGHFVPNLTIGAPVVKALDKVCNIPLDVHLMIENPEKYVKDFALAGSDIITFHYEVLSSIDPAYSVTIFNGASSPLTLKIMLGVTLAAVPVVIVYQAWVFWTFRHKVTEEAINNDSHAY